MAVKVEAFLEIEAALTKKLLYGWYGISVTLLPKIYDKLKSGDSVGALSLIDSIDLSAIVKKNQEYFKFTAYSSLFFGASRLNRDLKSSIIAKGGLSDLVDASVKQISAAVLKSVQDTVRQELRDYVAQTELEDPTAPYTASERLFKFNPNHEPAGSPKGGQFAKAVTNTAEFKAWFGGSKVVDVEGKPLVVYHGTLSSFDEFGNPYANKGWEMFSTSSEFSNRFTEGEGGNILPVYLSVQKPLDLSSLPRQGGDARVKVLRFLERSGIDTAELKDTLPYERDLFQIINRGGHHTNLSSAIQAAGFDGIKMPDAHGDLHATTYIVFRSEQIKSAIGNTGAFDPKDKRITKYEQILKFNPYHDEIGRFTTGDKAVFISIGDKAAKSVARFQDEQSAADKKFFQTASESEMRDKLRGARLEIGPPDFLSQFSFKAIDSESVAIGKDMSRRVRSLYSQMYHEKTYLRDRFGINPLLKSAVVFGMQDASGRAWTGGSDSVFAEWLASKSEQKKYARAALAGRPDRIGMEFIDTAKSILGDKDDFPLDALVSADPPGIVNSSAILRKAVNTASLAGMRSLIRHEWGHNLTKTSMSDLANQTWKAYPVATIEKHLGNYATTKLTEFAAELFAAYTSPSYVKGTMPKEYEKLGDVLIANGRARSIGKSSTRVTKQPGAISMQPISLKPGFRWVPFTDQKIVEGMDDTGLFVVEERTGKTFSYEEYVGKHGEPYKVPKDPNDLIV